MEYKTAVLKFKDANFEKFIRNIVNKSTGEITSEDMAGIEKLRLLNTEITDISGIEHCTNLKSLFINIQQITNLTVLEDLANLEILGLINYSPDSSVPPPNIDFTPLNYLSHLNELYTDLNQYSNFSSLADLSNLNRIELSIEINQANHLSELSNLVNLERLCIDFYESEISDLSPLSSLINLKYLEFRCAYNKNIRDLSPLRVLSKLDEFRIYDSEITDFSDVAHVKNVITEPYSIFFPVIKNNSIPAINKVSKLYSTPILKSAAFEQFIRNTINKPTGEITSEDMAGIEKLWMQGFELSDISGIEYCVNLKHLNLKYTNLKDRNFNFDISPLSRLTNLRTLSLRSENIIDITPLSKLTNLTNLFLDLNMNVTDLTSLSGLIELTQLVIIQSGVNNLSPLSGMAKLEELWLVGRSVKDYSPVAHVKNVQNIRRYPFSFKSTWNTI